HLRRSVHLDHHGAPLPGDLGGGIGATIAGHDHLERAGLHSGPQRVKQPAQHARLVVGGHYHAGDRGGIRSLARSGHSAPPADSVVTVPATAAADSLHTRVFIRLECQYGTLPPLRIWSSVGAVGTGRTGGRGWPDRPAPPRRRSRRYAISA